MTTTKTFCARFGQVFSFLEDGIPEKEIERETLQKRAQLVTQFFPIHIFSAVNTSVVDAIKPFWRKFRFPKN